MTNYQIQEYEIAEFIHAYIVAMLWSTAGDHGIESLEDYEVSPECKARCESDCRTFIDVAAPLLIGYTFAIHPAEGCSAWAMAGHDFWLTRAGHGAGYWDRGLDDIGDQLTALCGHGTAFQNLDPYIGDDGLVYFS